MKKNKFTHKLLFLSAISSLTFASCKKGCTDPVASNFDKNAKIENKSCIYPDPSISLSSPTENQVIHTGDTLKISGTASYFSEMHGWNVYLFNKTSGDTVFTDTEHVHGATLDIQSSWVDTLSLESDLELGISVTINHEGKTKSTSVMLKSMP